LRGKKLVRLAFIDEAGISKPQQEPFLVVAGVVIHGDNALNGVENELERIMKRHISSVHWDDFVFHATELFNGGGRVFKREKLNLIGPPQWPLDRRLRIADEIMAIPKKFALNIAFGFLERAKFSAEFDIPATWSSGEMVVAQQVCAFSTCTLFIEQWMRKNTSGENCMLVVENNDEAKAVIRNTNQWHQSKKVTAVLDEFSKKLLPLRKIRQDPLFQDKRPSNALIVADFCAYVFKRVLMKDQRYDRFFEPIRKRVILFQRWCFEGDCRTERRPGLSNDQGKGWRPKSIVCMRSCVQRLILPTTDELVKRHFGWGEKETSDATK
jgi:hypothetical protein